MIISTLNLPYVNPKGTSDRPQQDPKSPFDWVAAKELKLSYNYSDAIVFAISPYSGNLNLSSLRATHIYIYIYFFIYLYPYLYPLERSPSVLCKPRGHDGLGADNEPQAQGFLGSHRPRAGPPKDPKTGA